eukprot:m.186445 g.186445  ORF g.186445 m.186445 type:complete len:185 (+) comp24765_c0_seq8:563-1117(+)
MATPSSETSNVHDDTPQPVHNGNRKEDEVDDSCCWCCGEGDDKFEGEWDVPKEVAFCKWFGTQIVDFREAKWPERVYEHTVKVKARTACGYVKIIVPDEGIKIDTSCAGCITGWVWCGGYRGDVNDEKGIALCMFAWWGCVQVYKASEWEKQNPSEDDDNRSQATGGPPDSPVVSSQPNSQHSI